MIDGPQHDAYQKPHEVSTALNLKEGEVMALLTGHSGFPWPGAFPSGALPDRRLHEKPA
jgi:hypothetical protein